MSTKKQRRAQMENEKKLLEIQQRLARHLQTLEASYATEHRDETRVRELTERARHASSSFSKLTRTLDEERATEIAGSPEKYWQARLFSAQNALTWKKMRLGELAERTRLIRKVGEKFRGMLPESVVERLSRAEESPGEIVIELSEMHSRNLELAAECLRLEQEEEKLKNALEADRVAYSNVAALNDLSHFEKEVLETLPNIPQKRTSRVSGFGLSYLSEVSSRKETLDLKLKGMEAEMERLRSVTVAAINAVENSGDSNNSRRLLMECETAASNFIKQRN